MSERKFIWILFGVVSIAQLTASADEVKVPFNSFSKKLNANDSLVLEETCDHRNVPASEPGAKVEDKGEAGKTMVGGATHHYLVSKGNESYYLTVVGKTSIDDIKKGNYKVTGTPLYDSGCIHRQEFRLADPGEKAPPCSPSSDTEPGSRK